MSEKFSKRSPPPWQVLALVANHLDPKTLAMASCVSKSWSISMSSDHLWQPICATHFPALSNLRATHPAMPCRRLFALGQSSANRRLQKSPNPLLALHDVVFAVDIKIGNSPQTVLTVVKPGGELSVDRNNVFRFDIGVDVEISWAVEAAEGVRITWNVVMGDLGGVFTMMDCRGKGSFLPGTGGWFSEELPKPGCCSSAVASGLVADLRLGLRGGGGGKVVVEKVSVGVLSIVSWRYICVDDGLRYLQHFLV